MGDHEQGFPIQGLNRQIGFVKGAWLGALLRALVTVAYIFCVQLASDGALEEVAYWLAVHSGMIGFNVGGIGGATCNPRQGAILSGTLSGASCLGLVIVPVGLISLTFPPRESDSVAPLALALLCGTIVMAIVGAIAGGMGAAAGQRSALERGTEP
ncbi:MAG: hypothetical protein HYR84_14410 [Planctomycetes bacterium]|nr:hypothetical protein [Planctomycetota bacterium]